MVLFFFPQMSKNVFIKPFEWNVSIQMANPKQRKIFVAVLVRAMLHIKIFGKQQKRKEKNTHLNSIFVLLLSIAPYSLFLTCLHFELCNFDHFAPSV